MGKKIKNYYSQAMEYSMIGLPQNSLIFLRGIRLLLPLAVIMAMKDKELLFAGWTVIHFWGNDILKKLDECVKVIEDAIFDIILADGDKE